MPTYDYKCERCEYTFEEDLKIADRKIPTETPCKQRVLGLIQASPICGGEVKQTIAAPYFGYDNIHTRHSTNNKEPGWYSDKIKDMKRQNPGHSMS